MTAAAYSTTSQLCSSDGCGRPHETRGLCNKHYKRALKSGAITPYKPVYDAVCMAPDCGATSAKRGYCDKHYRRMQRNGHLETVRQPPGLPQQRGDGYIDQLVDGRRRLQHIVIAEKAVGKPLPKGVEVHHVNEIRSDNSPGNLVICPDRSYHQLLHTRQKAFDECGHASWRKCIYCGQYDDLANMSGGVKGKALNAFYHRSCAAKYVRERKAIRKSQKI